MMAAVAGPQRVWEAAGAKDWVLSPGSLHFLAVWPWQNTWPLGTSLSLFGKGDDGSSTQLPWVERRTRCVYRWKVQSTTPGRERMCNWHQPSLWRERGGGNKRSREFPEITGRPVEEQALDPILQILERSSDSGACMRVCVRAHARSVS